MKEKQQIGIRIAKAMNIFFKATFTILIAFCVGFTFFQLLPDPEAQVDQVEVVSKPSLSPAVAYSFAKDFVKERLLSPASAVFPDTYEHKQLNDTTVFIKSYVDTVGSGSAVIRSNYSCKMVYLKYLDQMQIQSLVIE